METIHLYQKQDTNIDRPTEDFKEKIKYVLIDCIKVPFLGLYFYILDLSTYQIVNYTHIEENLALSKKKKSLLNVVKQIGKIHIIFFENNIYFKKIKIHQILDRYSVSYSSPTVDKSKSAEERYYLFLAKILSLNMQNVCDYLHTYNIKVEDHLTQNNKNITQHFESFIEYQQKNATNGHIKKLVKTAIKGLQDIEHVYHAICKKNKQYLQNNKKKVDAIRADLLDTILNIHLKKDSFVNRRKRCAFILLYGTGWRVSTLLKMEVRNIKELQHNKITTYEDKGVIKTFIFCDKSGKVFDEFKDDFNYLMTGQKEEDLFFITQTKKSINRSSFDHELNLILKKCGNESQQVFTTHSFRRTMLEDSMVKNKAEDVKTVMGHKDIKSTLHYDNREHAEKSDLEIYNKEKRVTLAYKKYISNLNKVRQTYPDVLKQQ